MAVDAEKAAPGPARGRRWPAILVRLVLSPIITEFLFGSTPISSFWALVPQSALWGCGALLCRELVRRRGLGRLSLLGMGVALTTALEFLAFQTSVAPPALPLPAVLAAGLVVAAMAFFLIRRWSAGPQWGDAHGLALCTGALMASMLLGFGIMQGMGGGPVDVVGKLILNVAAPLLLTRLAKVIRRRRLAAQDPSTSNSRQVRPSS
jgi:hypothetical protein